MESRVTDHSDGWVDPRNGQVYYQRKQRCVEIVRGRKLQDEKRGVAVSGVEVGLSAQLDIPFTRLPERHSQCYELLMAFQRGERLTVKSAMQMYGVYALSQRCQELRKKYGWNILSRTVEIHPKTRVSEYWMGDADVGR